MKDAQVVSLKVTRLGINFDHPTAGAELKRALKDGFGMEDLPLAPNRVEVELKGVPTAAANALRRVVLDELPGRCLTFGPDDFSYEETTDPFMRDAEYILTRIRNIPLRPQISESLAGSLKFELFAENKTASVATVYSGDLIQVGGEELKDPIFNPTHQLAVLQPGMALRIRNIHLAEGFGYIDAAFNTCARAALQMLDLEQHPRASTHERGGENSAKSGFVESSLVADPRHILVKANVLAVPGQAGVAASVFVDACQNIIRRLRSVNGMLESAKVQREPGGTTRWALEIPNETDTIGNLLHRAIYEVDSKVTSGYVLPPHEKKVTLTVSGNVADSDEIGQLVKDAVEVAIKAFGEIRRGIQSKNV